MHVKKWKPGLWIFLLCSLILVQLEAFAGIRMPIVSPTLLATVSGTAESTAETLSAKVTEVEKFGNVVLDLSEERLYQAGYQVGDLLSLKLKDEELILPLCTSYSDVDTGKLLFRDDTGKKRLLVAINMGNFAKNYNVSVGDELRFSLKEKGGYQDELMIRKLTRTNNRADYSSDSVFANFRAVVGKGMPLGILYRSSNPIDNQFGRAAYADKLCEAFGIQTVLNLADSEEEAKALTKKDGFASPYYKSLMDKGNVIYLNMGVDLDSEDFGNKLVEGLRFLSQHEGPYLIHCTEGKDRAGFATAIVSAFMGSDLSQLEKDYMLSFENFFGVEENSEKYTRIFNSNLYQSLKKMAKGKDPKSTDLKLAAEEFLAAHGMSKEEMTAVREKLSKQVVLPQPNVSGTVESVEKYGHLETDISISDFNALGFTLGDMVSVQMDNGYSFYAPYVDGYLVNAGDPLVRAYPGKEKIALCINYGKLNQVAKADKGTKVRLFLQKKGAYLEQYAIRKLTRSNNRADYASDEIFANFRNIKTTGIKKGVLYRSSSPINNELGRAAIANKLMEKHGIKTVVNLADSQKNIDTYLSKEDFQSPYYKSLLDSGNVALLNLGLNFRAVEFRKGITDGARFILEHDGPYLFHCTEGKDRTGFMAVFLESLAGADAKEIKADYMESYTNFFHVKKGTKQYKLIEEDVIGMMESISGSKDVSKKALQEGAMNMLRDYNFTEYEIQGLKDRLAGKAYVEPTVDGKNAA